MNKEMDLHIKQIELNDRAAQSFGALKTELGISQKNEHIGSGLGGNPNELFFLLSHKVKVQGLSDGEIDLFQIGDSILFKIPVTASRKELRLALTKFIDKHPDKTNYTREQLLNPSFLRDLQSPALEVQLLAKALEIGYDLASWLDIKISLQEEINKVFSKETRTLEINFLKEMNLPEDYFEVINKNDLDREADPMEGMFIKHPVWGTKVKNANKRETEMCERLLSEDDMQKLNMLGSFPPYIFIYSFRSCIGIERMVVLNLDEKVKFFDDINRRLESGMPSKKSKDSDED